MTPLWPQNELQYVFGTTAVDSSGLRGEVFYVKDGAVPEPPKDPEEWAKGKFPGGQTVP